MKATVLLSLIACYSVVACQTVHADFRPDFKQLFVLQDNGAISAYDSSFEMRADIPSLEFSGYIKGCISNDQHALYIAVNGPTQSMYKVDTTTFRTELLELAHLPLPDLPSYVDRFAVSFLFNPINHVMYLRNSAFFNIEEKQDIFIINLTNGAVNNPKDFILTASSRVRVSDDGSEILALAPEWVLIDSESGQIKRKYALHDVPIPKQVGEFVVHGIETHWAKKVASIWRTRMTETGMRTEQAKLDMTSGDITILDKINPWPLEPFPLKQTLKRNYQSYIAAALGAPDRGMEPNSILTLQQAQVVNHIKPVILMEIDVSKMSQCYLSPPRPLSFFCRWG